MQSQYEEHPYPRWRSAISRPKRNFFSRFKDGVVILTIIISKKIFLLPVVVQDSKDSCSKIENTNIYAIDFMKSLSYAKRQINELNINNEIFII